MAKLCELMFELLPHSQYSSDLAHMTTTDYSLISKKKKFCWNKEMKIILVKLRLNLKQKIKRSARKILQYQSGAEMMMLFLMEIDE